MMKVYVNKPESLKREISLRGSHSDSGLSQLVEQIIRDVQNRGDEALLESARKFDAPSMTSIHVTGEEIETASVEHDLEEAIRLAKSRVLEFHSEQLRVMTHGLDANLRWDRRGVGQRLLPITKAGVYVPGGRAVYPSSVIMNAVPALAAGVPGVMITTPAQGDGTLHPAVLVAMREVGISRAVKVGGAAAVAAMALGTESIPRVDKVVGPGNKYVNEAKRQLWGRCGFDGFASASEVCVLVDSSADARFAALDFLTQIEHAPDNVGFLVSTSEPKLHEILRQIDLLKAHAKDPAGIEEALAGSTALVCENLEEATDWVNIIAPEHLSLSVSDPATVLPLIQTAACVLMGEWTPESAGDYVLGPSHTLPTGGAGRWQSPVNVMDFLKFQSVSHMTAETLQPLIGSIDVLARTEGFSIHAEGATARRTGTDHLSEVRGC
jgi:histidinol dehydrogenase